MTGEKMPQSFRNVRNVLTDKGVLLDRNEYFFLLVHVLMLECGFITTDCREYYNDQDFGYHYRRILNCVDRLPPNWKRSNTVYSVTYYLPPFLQYPCRVTCAECAEDIVVNTSVDGLGGVSYSLLIDPSRYVIVSATILSNKFQDIWHLSRSFKSAIGNPARNIIMRRNCIPAYCLEDLPIEILWYIMQYFDPKTLARFERTCTFFRELCHDDTLWKKIPGRRCDNFQYFKKYENAKIKLESLFNRSHWRRVD